MTMFSTGELTGHWAKGQRRQTRGNREYGNCQISLAVAVCFGILGRRGKSPEIFRVFRVTSLGVARLY